MNSPSYESGTVTVRDNGIPYRITITEGVITASEHPGYKIGDARNIHEFAVGGKLRDIGQPIMRTGPMLHL